MDNPHMFDELTNRLNKVKRPDSGIHNSGEFIGENEKLEKSDEQADSGRDSDPAEPADVDAADGSGGAKKGGILKSFKKMFKIRRKTKTGKIKDDKDHDDDDDKVISSQYKAASEPDIINSGSSKQPDIPRSNTGMPPKRYIDSPNMNDFTSDDEETKIDEKKSSLKDAPSFIRSSLRKLKLKKKKSGGMDSNEVTPTSVKRTNTGVPPPISPKKSPKKPRSSSRSSHSSDQTEPRNDSFNKDFNHDPDDVYLSGKSSRTDSLSSQPVAVNLKDDLQSYQPVIESTAAKDKIRIAPRGRKRPTRVRTQSKAAEISEKLSPLAQISEDDSHDGGKHIESKSIFAEIAKKPVKEIPKKPTDNKLETNINTHIDSNGSVSIDDKHRIGEIKKVRNNAALEKTFDSVISSLESARNKPDVLVQKKSSPDSKTRALTDPTSSPLPKVLPKPEKPVSKHTSRESIDSISSNSRRNTDSSTSSRKSIDSTKGSVENVDRQSLKSISLGDLVIETEDASPARRSKSFQKEIEINDNQRKHLSEVGPLKDDSPDKNRYDKYRKSRSQTIPDNRNVKETISSKSVEDVSILNKENYRRSGHFVEPLGTPYQKDVNRENLINETRLAINDENIRRSKEHLKKSSSRHSLNETTFAITSSKNSQDPIIPYGSSNISSELSFSPDKPRKLQKRTVSGSKDDITKSTTRKPRPQSVTIRSTDTNIIFGKVSGARSYGDIRSLVDMPESEKSNGLPPISKKSKPVVNNETSRTVDKPILSHTGKSKSVDVTESVVTASNVPEFKRMSLRKTPKAEDYLPKEMLDKDSMSVDVEEENPVLSSIKTTLKHVETKANVDISREAKQEEVVEQCTKIENELNTSKDKKLPSPIVVEAKQLPIDVSGPVEIRETKDKAPEFHRISLKKVEKRDDYLEKEPGTGNLKADNGESDQITEKNEMKTNSAENIVSPHNEVSQTVSSPNEEDIPREKPKPPVKAKPFQFQSHDVKGSDSKPQSNPDKPKAVPLSQTGKLPYFRKSVDIQENPHGSVPAWIAMAREKQRDEASDKNDDDIAKETADKSEDVTSESLVKPSAFKPKPNPMPKPTVASKPETSPTSTSPPAVAKKPPPVSQRPSLGRFNAKTDLPKDACMVCRKTVYVLERCEVNKRTLHRACAKCHVCSRTLNVGDIFISDEKVWCKQHR